MLGYQRVAGLALMLVGMVLSGASAFGSSEAYKPRSKAARSPEVAKFLEKYSFVRFRQAPHTPMPIEAGSLAAKDQQFGLIVMDLRFLNAPATRFAGMLPSAGMSLTAPLLADYVAEKKLAAEYLLQKFVNLVNRDHPAFAKALEPTLKTFKNHTETAIAQIFRDSFEPLRDVGFSSEQERVAAILEIAGRMETDFSGLLGELYMAVALPGTLRISTKVRDIPELMAIIDKLKPAINSRILASPAELAIYERDFPMLFWTPVEKIPMSEPLEGRLSRIWDRILNEEVDVFRKSGLGYFIGESKVSSKPFDADAFAKKAGFAHTRAEQAESKRQLSALLSQGGVKVQHEYMVSAGFEKSLAQEMISKGWILHSPPPCTLLAEGQGE